MANKFVRLTTVDDKGFARLINPLQVDRAIGRLCDYENVGLSVEEIKELVIRVENLTERIKTMEAW